MTWFLGILFCFAVSGRIDTVFVYPNQVVVVRSAQVDLKGEDQLVFSGLPGAVNDNSVRVRASGVRLGEVQVKRGYIAEPTPLVKRLEERVRILEDSVKALDDEATVLKAKEEFLNSVKLGAPEMIAKELQQGKVVPEAWRSALGFIGNELTEVKMRQQSVFRRKGDVEKRLAAVRKELQDARALMENRKEVRVEVDAEPGTYRVVLSYAIPRGADWQPYYELRAKPAAEAVEVTYFARLAQRTGEDWDNVKVILSTAVPLSDVRPPEPQPWYLTLWEETYRAKAMPAPGISEAMEVSVEEADERWAQPPEPDYVQAVESGVALQYVIPGRISLKSGEPAKKLELKQIALPASFEYYTLPRTLEKAFLTAKMVNTSEFIFLAGSGNTYVGDEFTGGTAVPTIAPQESLAMGFGVDERVKVRRELVKTFKSKVGVLGRTERMQFVYRTTVENYHPKPLKIKVIEQVPVSQQKEIKVTVTKIEPKPAEQNENEGTYTYQLELKNRERLEINLEYWVDYPAGRRVVGLY